MSIRSTPREERARITKETITRSAMRLFTEYGCDKVTIDDICADCGLTKGAFYHSFPSKDHIVVLSFNLCLDAYLQEYFVLDDSRPVLEQLVELDMAAMDFCFSVGKDVTASTYEAALRSKIDVRISGRTYVCNLERLVQRGMEEGVFCSGLSFLEQYLSLVAVFSGMAIKWAMQPPEMDAVLDWKKLIRAQLTLAVKG